MASGDLVRHGPVSADLLRRILAGAAVSPYIPLGNREILAKQGLIGAE